VRRSQRAPPRARGRLAIDSASRGRAPVLLDEQLVTDLPKNPAFESVVSTIHGMADFFLRAAADAFSVRSPAYQHARGVSGIAPARAMLMYFRRC
jgi:hypothetical protein